MSFVGITDNKIKSALLAVMCCLLVLVFYSNSINKPELGDDIEANPNRMPHQASPLAEVVETLQRELVEDVSPAMNPITDLTGLVVDRLGAPIANASVAVLSQQIKRHTPEVVPYSASEEDSARIIQESISDSDGRFAFVLEPGSTYDLLISAAGFGTTRRSSVFTGQAMTIVLDQASSLWGIVSDYKTGKAIGGAKVMVRQGVIGGNGYFAVYSSADGSYEITDLPEGVFSAYATAANYKGSSLGRSFVVKAGAAVQHDISMRHGNMVWGTISDAESGLPIIGATVRSSANQEAITDVNGKYVLKGIANEMLEVISASADKYGRYDYPIATIPEQGLELNLGLLPGRSAHGTVVDDEGHPISGAYVSLAGYLRRPEFGSSDEQRDKLFARTNSEGAFFFNNLRVDVRHTLYLAATGFGSEVFDLPQSEWDSNEVDLGEIILHKGASIGGRVLALDETPITGIWVALNGFTDRRDELGPYVDSSQGYNSGGGFGLGSVGIRTDDRGRFFFNELPAGQYYLAAGNKGSINGAEKELSLVNAEQALGVIMYLDEGLSIEGVVLDEAGSPVVAQTVSLGSVDNPFEQITYNFTGIDGSFKLSGLEVGDFSIWCNGRAFPSDSEIVDEMSFLDVIVSDVAAGTKDLRIVLPKAKLTQGIVVDSNGEAAAMVNVYIEQHGWLTMLDTTNSMGEFAIWLDPKKGTPVHFYPAPAHVDLQWAWHYDENNKIDMSYELVLNNIVAGQEDVVVNLTVQ